jgi:hypothetical protein
MGVEDALNGAGFRNRELLLVEERSTSRAKSPISLRNQC